MAALQSRLGEKERVDWLRLGGDLRNRRHRASLDRGTFRYPGPHTSDGRENGVPSSSAGLLC